MVFDDLHGETLSADKLAIGERILKTVPTKRASKKAVVIITAAVFFFFGFGALGYIYVYPNFFFNPEKILYEAIGSQFDVRTAQSEIKLRLASSDGLKSVAFTLALDGGFADEFYPIGSYLLILDSLKIDKLTISGASIDGRLKNKDLSYIKIALSENLIRAASAALNLNLRPYASLLNNQWITVNAPALKEKFQSTAAGVGFPNLNVSDSLMSFPFTAADRQEFFTIIKSSLDDHPIFQNIRVLEKEVLDDQSAYHLQANIDLKISTELMADIFPKVAVFAERRMNPSGTPAKRPIFDPASLEQLKNISGIALGDFHFWIGSKDRLLHKFSAAYSLKAPFSDQPMQFSIVVANRRMNHVVSVTDPEGARDALDIYDDFSVDEDKDRLSRGLERYYGTDDTKVDTDGDSYTDGEEVSRGYNPLGSGTFEDGTILFEDNLFFQNKTSQESRKESGVEEGFIYSDELPNEELIFQSMLRAGTKEGTADDERLADLGYILEEALPLYYEKCGFYPGDADAGTGRCIAASAPKVWNQLETVLRNARIGITGIPYDPARASGRTYYFGTAGPDARKYVIGATLDNSKSPLFKDDDDGEIFGVNCDDPVFCAILNSGRTF